MKQPICPPGRTCPPQTWWRRRLRPPPVPARRTRHQGCRDRGRHTRSAASPGRLRSLGLADLTSRLRILPGQFRGHDEQRLSTALVAIPPGHRARRRPDASDRESNRCPMNPVCTWALAMSPPVPTTCSRSSATSTRSPARASPLRFRRANAGSWNGHILE